MASFNQADHGDSHLLFCCDAMNSVYSSDSLLQLQCSVEVWISIGTVKGMYGERYTGMD